MGTILSTVVFTFYPGQTASEGNHKAAITLTDVDIVVLLVKIKILSRKLRFFTLPSRRRI